MNLNESRTSKGCAAASPRYCSFAMLRTRVGTIGVGIALTAAITAPPEVWLGGTLALAQTATPAARQIGTVTAISEGKLTITADVAGSGTPGGAAAVAKKSIDVDVADGARVLRLAPGSTDLKAAQTIQLVDIEVGDRVLVTGHLDAPDAFTASRVILMKSTDIAQKHDAEQEDWQKRGVGGLVSAFDVASETITIAVREKKIAVKTSSTTIFRRYAAGSVKFEDATPGTLSQIQPGDQLRVRGAKSIDPASGQIVSIAADEIVSGSFKNLAGTIVSIDSAGSTVTLKDLASKRSYVIKVTPTSDLRALPPEDAARFAAREKGAGPGAAGSTGLGGAGPVSAAGVAVGDPHGSPGAGSAGTDLSQLLKRLPQGSLSALHTGAALMVVASQTQPGGDALTAITVLSGVEPILAATPKGEASMTLSPWNVGSAPDGGGI